MPQPGRNDACPCGSGKKYKHCCALKKEGISSRLIMLLIAGAILVALIATASQSIRGPETAGRVWSPEHGHYHDAGGREVPR